MAVREPLPVVEVEPIPRYRAGPRPSTVPKKSRLRTFRGEAAGGRARLAAGTAGVAATAAGAAAGAQSATGAAISGRGALWLQIVGGVLLLALIYLLVAGKGPAAFGKIAGVLWHGVDALIAPVDPIYKLETALGATPVSAAGTAGEASPAPGGAVPTGGKLSPTGLVPGSGGDTTSQTESQAVKKGELLPAKAMPGEPSAGLLEKWLTLSANRAKHSRATVSREEEKLIPRSTYPRFYRR